jgi:transposase-like protein
MWDDRQRIGIVKGTKHRRRWTVLEKPRIVGETLRSGDSISASVPP